jgi:hypothetical protein
MATRSDRQGQLVERDHQPSAQRLLDREFVVSAPEILNERMPPITTVVLPSHLSPRTGHNRAFNRP